MAEASSSTSEPVANGGPKKYTIEELKEHTTRESLWVLLHDKVYDVTKFCDEHPGGDEVILEEAGRDATEAFEDVGHSDEARAMLPKMLLGEFKGEPGAKGKKSLSTATSTASSSSSNTILIVGVVGVVGAYLAWRVFLA